MREAIQLAAQGKGATAPNPCVGAVLVQDGRIVASGWHTRCGKPHAEIEALADARAKNIDPAACTLFVTLEPCNHTGKTPPCTQAILEAAIPKVIIGARDPNPHVQGGGAVFLHKQGVNVETGVLEQECTDLIADFTLWQHTRRPYSILKLAATLDGKIATKNGHAAWVSGETSRTRVQQLRSWTDAVIVGGETFRKDNPSLTCRQEGFQGPQPLAVIVTRHLPEEKDIAAFTLLTQRPQQTMFWTTAQEAASKRGHHLKAIGCGILPLSAQGTGLNLAEGLTHLYEQCHCSYTLCEGGGALAMSLLEQHLADEIILFQAIKILGDNTGRACFSGRNISSMQDAISLRLGEVTPCGEDLMYRVWPQHHQRKAPCSPDSSRQ
ncbi:MAG: riboflavin biosynthesis protein RibD [Deltaproteobacteria bacterium]|nr:MAG: riboflavin biosynthesis protein RibD [Deltaproteobacteria bacterium]